MGSPQQRAMLVALLLRPRGTASMAALVEALWGDDPPATAAKNVRTYAWRWRKVLRDDGPGPRLLTTTGDGYRMVLPGEAVDVRHVEILAQRARQTEDREQAHALLTEALSLWNGEALAGVPGPYAQRQRRRLNELRLHLLEWRLGLDIELGRAAWRVPELRSLSDENPLRESLHILLMRALQASGRQGEAVAVFPAARRRFVEELGIEPGVALADAHRQLLSSDVPPYTPAPGQGVQAPPHPAQIPAATADFTGRAHLAGVMADALSTTERGSLPLVTVSGMGGVGKTTLAQHVAHRIKAHYPHGQLYADLRSSDTVPASPQDILAGFLGTLGVDSVPDCLDGRAALFRSVTHDRRLLIVLDDAYSLAQISPLLPGSATCGVLITSRSRMTGLTGAVHIDLDVFDPAEALELLSRVIGAGPVSADRETARELVMFCGLLPLAVRIVAARLAARPAWTIALLRDRLADERHRLDTLRAGDLDVSASFMASWRRLSNEQQRVLVMLADAGAPDFSLHTATLLLDRPELETEDLLEGFVDFALLASATPGRYQFHPLVRSFIRARDPGSSQRRSGSGPPRPSASEASG
ncbi:MAG: BTAD domain-containing putative transcriptional regulator [Actinoplanes sp.]